ncbi:MAG: tetratricopeptide repeat protein [Planctomycetes bacterium]|nr:tetratricopeptide repeat protein [Planctomycetota bacterium]
MFCDGDAVNSVAGKQGSAGNSGRINILTILALLSGCCGLAYEVLYVRALTAILGDMFYVHAALLSTFLIGIGLGAKLAHRWLRWLWVFEILTGLYALGLPILSGWFSEQPVMTPITSSASLTVFATMCFISIPSLLIGFSIPLFSAYIKAYSPERLSFQLIYKAYNLGAFLSILSVELILIKLLGISTSLAVIGAVNIFNGIILILMRLSIPRRPTIAQRSFPKTTVAALALASMGSAIFQMFFLKLSYLVFYPHRENFAIGLAITMLGIFLGASLATKLRIRFETFLLTAAVLIGLIYVSYMPILRAFEATIPLARNHELLILLHKFIFGCIFALGPMIAFGALIPSLMYSENEVAGESGYLLMVSSFANATGYLIYASIGHPLMTNAVLLASIVGVMLVGSLLATKLRLSKVCGALAVCSITLAILLIFQWEDRNFYLAHWANKLQPEDKVTIFKSGAESATLVHTNRVFKSESEAKLVLEQKTEKIWEEMWISYNGHPSITIQSNGIIEFAEIAVGVIPALAAPSLDRALVIGLGTGITAGATCHIFNATDVVEINNAFYKMMPFLSYANFDIEHNQRATLHLTDGRAFLVGKDGVYDAIINTVSAPTYFSAAKIYTLDFYALVKKSLKPNGIFCTWLSPANMSEEGILTILSALQHNFRYCEIRLLRGNYYLLTCSNQPIRPRRQFSDLLPSEHHLVKQLQLGLSGFDLDEFFVDTRLSDNIFDHFVSKVTKENTDDHPVLEFMVVRDYQLGTMGSDPFLYQQSSFNIEPVRQHELKNAARFARRVGVFYRLGSGYLDSFKAVISSDPNVASEFFLLTAGYNIERDNFDEANKHLSVALKIKPNFAEAHNKLGEVLVLRGNTNGAIKHFNLAIEIRSDFAEAYNNLGHVLISQDKFNEAVGHFRQALKADPSFIQTYNNLGNALASQGKAEDAIKVFQKALAYNEQSDSKNNMADIHLSLGIVLKKSNNTQQAEEEFIKAKEEYRNEISENRNSVKLVVGLAKSLQETNNLNEATKYFQQAVTMSPGNVENHLALAQVLVAQERYDEATKVLEKGKISILQAGNEKGFDELEKHLELIESKKSEATK